MKKVESGCLRCGRVVRVSTVEAVIRDLGEESEFEFRCPECGGLSVRPVTAELAGRLLDAGCLIALDPVRSLSLDRFVAELAGADALVGVLEAEARGAREEE